MMVIIRGTFGSKYSRMDCVKFLEDSLQKIWSDIVSLGRPYHFKLFKGCLPPILLSPFLNMSTHLELCQTTMEELFFCKSSTTYAEKLHHRRDKVFNSGLSKFCGRRLFKNLKGYGLLKQMRWDEMLDM